MPRRAEVEKWLASYDNPMKPVIARVRNVILSVDARVDECIKWQTPTFTFAGNIASFNPRSKNHASLLFHTGATIPGKHPRLEGDGSVTRTMRFTSLAEVAAFERDLVRVIQAWIAMKSDARPGTGRGPNRNARAARGAGRPSARASRDETRRKKTTRSRRAARTAKEPQESPSRHPSRARTARGKAKR